MTTSLRDLDVRHYNAFTTALTNLLRTDVAEHTFAEIIDGIPTAQTWSSSTGRRHDIIEALHDLDMSMWTDYLIGPYPGYLCHKGNAEYGDTLKSNKDSGRTLLRLEVLLGELRNSPNHSGRLSLCAASHVFP